MEKGDELAGRFAIDAVIIATVGAILVGLAQTAYPDRVWIIGFLVGVAGLTILAVLLFGHIDDLIVYHLDEQAPASESGESTGVDPVPDTDADEESDESEAGFVWTNSS